jgi:hypothetical protein
MFMDRTGTVWLLTDIAEAKSPFRRCRGYSQGVPRQRAHPVRELLRMRATADQEAAPSPSGELVEKRLQVAGVARARTLSPLHLDGDVLPRGLPDEVAC